MLRTLVLLTIFVSAQALAQQTGTIEGQVTDTSGALIPGASVTIVPAGGQARSVTTNETGSFSVGGLAPGKYDVRVTSTGFAPLERSVTVSPGRPARIEAALKIMVETQKVTVEGEAQNTVSTDPSNNAGAIVLRNEDLESLSDDPDELADDLRALAGPAAGPNGGQIYIDGFTGAQLPPKAAIREVRINQNPFSAEFDRLGFGRIEIFTKPGADRFRGQAMFSYSNKNFNARNPYVPYPSNFDSKLFNINVGGPITKRSSYFIDAERRNISDNAIVNATVLNPDLTFGAFQGSILEPQRRTSVSPRIDYQLSTNNTLVARYHFMDSSSENAGLSEFTLPSRAFNRTSQQHTVQLTETAVLNPRMINETRLQYSRADSGSTALENTPAINVLESFSAGGAPVGLSSSISNRWEVHNITSLTHSTHTIRFGGRFRHTDMSQVSPNNFLGTFTFGGGFGPVLGPNNEPVLGTEGTPELTYISSLERYRRTLLLQSLGYSAADIRALGGGATQFSISGGNPLAGVDQMDIGVFVQDDWRVRRNVTVSLGLRYETQNNIHDWTDFAPRIGVAWAPGSRGGRNGKTVIRGGVGVFYDRIDDDLTLDIIRFNGINQQRFIINNPDFFPTVPAASELQAQQVPQTIRRFDATLRAPYIMQSAIGIERQLGGNTTAAVTFTNSRGLHMLRSRALPVADAATPGELAYFYESTGILKQNQLMFNVNSRFSRRVSIFSFYVLNHAKSDTDGAASFPAEEWNLQPEYGRAGYDIRHRFMIGGALTAPWGVHLSPFITGRSGSPFNITSGRDVNGDTIFNDRPAFANAGDPGAVVTPWGIFNPRPLPGQAIIPRNYGEGPGNFTINLRISKTFGFGESRSAAAGSPTEGGGDRGGGRGGRGGGGGRMGGGGMRMGGAGGGGMRGMFGDATTNSRYNLTISASARNLLNNVNPADPIGNLTSPRFGQSISLASGFGPDRAASINRRLEVQLRFTF